MSSRDVSLIVLATLVLAGCDSVHSESRYALGPVEVTIQVVAPSERKAKAAIDKAFDAISQVNNLLSSYAANSEVSRLNRSGGRECHISGQTAAVLRRAIEISEHTGGAFDITAGPLIKLWKTAIKTEEQFREWVHVAEAAAGFGLIPVQLIYLCREEIEKSLLPTKAELDAARKLVGCQSLTLGPNSAKLETPGMSIDLGGIAKGYAVDKAIEALKASGIRAALVDAGGDGYALGTRPDGTPWRIAVQKPDDETGERLPGILKLADAAYATSGDYEQYVDIGGVRYTHIIDPRTGRPARAAASVTVIAPDCTTADALATGISVLGPDDGVALAKKLKGVECMVITREGSDLKTTTSPGLKKFQTLD